LRNKAKGKREQRTGNREQEKILFLLFNWGAKRFWGALEKEGRGLQGKR